MRKLMVLLLTTAAGCRAFPCGGALDVEGHIQAVAPARSLPGPPGESALALCGGTDPALALLGRKFEVLTRVRRAYYDYLGWALTVRASEEVVAVLERGLGITRRLVEEAKSRPRTDLLRTEALLEEAQISLVRSKASRDGA